MAEPAFKSLEALDSRAFGLGARAMRLERAGRTVKPQQLEVAGVLGAGHRFNAITMPRRSTKSTSLFAWELGRCLSIPEHRGAWVFGTSGKAARQWFGREAMPQLDRSAAVGEFALRWRIFRAAGMERVEFDNGSVLAVLGPNGDEFRGSEFTDIVIDEAQELDAETGDDILSAVLPTMDTNPNAMLVLAGTAGQRREGNVLWAQLERGRRGEGGILEYAVPQTLAVEDFADWEQVAPLLLQHHPGLASGMTTLEILQSNFERIRDKSRFAAEYLGLWGSEGSSMGVFDVAAWNASALQVATLPTPPARFALAFAASPNQNSGAIVAAWRDPEGRGHLLLIDHRAGTRWISDRGTELALRYRAPLHYDDFGVNLIETTKMARRRPKPLLAPQNTKQTSTAAAQLVEEVRDQNIRHYDQGPLTAAILLARRRQIGAKAYAYGRAGSDDDIAAAEAASIALYAFDQMMQRRPVEVLRPTA